MTREILDSPTTADPRGQQVPVTRTAVIGRSARYRSFLSACLASLAIAGALIGAVFSWAAYRTGSARAAFAYLRGDNLFASPGAVTVSGNPSDVKSVTILNLTNEPIHVLGYNAICSCVKVRGLPVDLGPRERRDLPIYAVSGAAQEVDVVFLTDRLSERLARVEVKVAPGGD
jgi:hypothetical protein